MKVYLSGPISLGGKLTPDKYAANIQRFRDAAVDLRSHGYEVLCPVEVPEQPSWADYMRVDLRMILDAEAIVVLPGWEESRGACLECHVARELGMPIYPLAEICDGSQSA